jgi:hypothetical protein
MTQYATWASYGWDARTWLAVGLLAAAVAAALKLLAFAAAFTLFLNSRKVEHCGTSQAAGRLVDGSGRT